MNGERTRFTSGREAAENGKKGGKQSAKRRKEYKSFCEAARWYLSMETSAEIDGEKIQVSQYQRIVLELAKIAQNPNDKRFLQVVQLLMQLTNSTDEKTRAEIARIQAETKRLQTFMKSGTDNGLLFELITDLQRNVEGAKNE